MPFGARKFVFIPVLEDDSRLILRCCRNRVKFKLKKFNSFQMPPVGDENFSKSACVLGACLLKTLVLCFTLP